MKSGSKYVTSTRIKEKLYWRFRQKGCPMHYFKAPIGTKEFEREYADCLSTGKPSLRGNRIAPGSVSDVIARYYSDFAFRDVRPATQ